MKKVLIALGSNLFDREKNLQNALEHLKVLGIVEKHSSFWNTAPVGGPPQDDFLNAVALLHTALSPQEVLKKLSQIEDQMGRQRSIHWGPRTLDLDILLVDQEIIQEETLCIPHPRMHERLFVLQPAVEVAKDWVHPIFHQTVEQLCQNLLNKSSGIRH